MNTEQEKSSGGHRRIVVVDPEPTYHDEYERQGGDGDFGAWAPGVLDEFLAATLTDRKRMSSGVLVGRQAGGRPQIDGVIVTVQGGRSDQVAIDRTIWGWVHEQRAAHYPDGAVIGWFCSRPGLGGVPTEVDAETHRQFFPGGQQVLLCVDPVSLRVAAYLEQQESLVSIGGGDLHQMLGVRPTQVEQHKLAPELIGAALIGAAIGVLAWALAGAESWPF